METAALIRLLLHDNQLKRTARTGWVQRGVVHAESVATHTHGVCFIALLLAEVVGAEEPPDRARLLTMALLHDLPESLTSDIPSPAWRYLPAGVKHIAERGALEEILAEAPFAASWLTLWEELHTGETVEARLVQDADRLDLYLQALVYEEQTGNRQLAEFWTDTPRFHFAVAEGVYNALRRRRPIAGG